MATKQHEIVDEAVQDYKERENNDPKLKACMDTLRAELFRRGATGIAGLARKFRIIDKDHSGELDMSEFKLCMKECQLKFTDEECTTMFKFFDEDAGGTIGYDEFLFGVRGNMNVRREQMVLLAFEVLNKKKKKYVDIDDIQEAYDASKHPDVLAGKRTQKAIMREFLDTFDQGDKDGKVYPSEFKRYYANISASIDDDDYFELMIRNAWHIAGGEGWCANTANKRVLVVDPVTGEESIQCIENDLGMDASDPAQIKARLAQNRANRGIHPGGAGGQTGVMKNTNATAKLGGSNLTFNAPPVEKVKVDKPKSHFGESSIKITGGDLGYGPAEEISEEDEKMGWSKTMPESTKVLLKRMKMNLKRRGANGIVGLARKFRIIDKDGSGELDINEFKLCMKECQLNFAVEETEELFKFFDNDAGGTISYNEFLGGLRGELNMRRAQLTLLAFDILDSKKQGYVDIDDIADKYDAKAHPDVITGKKTAKEVLKEFLDTFDQGDKDGKVTPDEFCQYYSNVSASVDLDDYFELMIRNAWHIAGGEGWCANTANKRVLVTGPDGVQTVQCINNDLGLDLSNPEAIAEALRKQGVAVGSVQTVGKLEDDKAKAPPVTSAPRGKTAAFGASNLTLGGDTDEKPKVPRKPRLASDKSADPAPVEVASPKKPPVLSSQRNAGMNKTALW
jgi:Ca2+-binding EF-hand superfamily protein